MGFDGMTVTLQSPRVTYVSEYAPTFVEETVTAPETAVQRFVRLFTRKSAPVQQITHEVPAWNRVPVHHFHTVEVDDTHDSEDVRTLLDKLTDRYDHEIVSVIAEVDGVVYEMVDGYNTSPTGDHVGTFLVALMDEPYRAAGVVNAAKEYGIDSDMTDTWMDDHYHGEWSSEAEYAENLVSDCFTTDIPDFVEIDWDETANNLSDDYDFVTDRETGAVHVFSRY